MFKIFKKYLLIFIIIVSFLLMFHILLGIYYLYNNITLGGLIPIYKSKDIISTTYKNISDEHGSTIIKLEYRKNNLKKLKNNAKKMNIDKLKEYIINSDICFGTSKEKVKHCNKALDLINKNNKYIINADCSKYNNNTFCSSIKIIVINNNEVYQINGK